MMISCPSLGDNTKIQCFSHNSRGNFNRSRRLDLNKTFETKLQSSHKIMQVRSKGIAKGIVRCIKVTLLLLSVSPGEAYGDANFTPQFTHVLGSNLIAFSSQCGALIKRIRGRSRQLCREYQPRHSWPCCVMTPWSLITVTWKWQTWRAGTVKLPGPPLPKMVKIAVACGYLQNSLQKFMGNALLGCASPNKG